MGTKISKQALERRLDSAEIHRFNTGAMVSDLPKTPGRSTVERGLETVKEGLAQIRKEAELPEKK